MIKSFCFSKVSASGPKALVEKIEATDEEINAKIEEMAKNANVSVKDYKKNLNENRINYFKNEILMNKLLTFLVDKNVKKSK